MTRREAQRRGDRLVERAGRAWSTIRRPRSLSELAASGHAMVDTSMAFPGSAVRSHVDSLRIRNPQASPAEVIAILGKEYRALVAGTGAGVGTAAAVPALGTASALWLAAGDAGAFITISAAYATAVADVHGLSADEPERRRALVLASLLGPRDTAETLASGGSGTAMWGRALLVTIPKGNLSRVNGVLSRKWARRQLTRHLPAGLGKAMPFGLGAVIGYTSGLAMARTVIAQATSAFGPPPEQFTRALPERPGPPREITDQGR